MFGLNDDLAPLQSQTIIWANVGLFMLLSTGPLETNFSDILIVKIFIQENAFENVVCKMAAILSHFKVWMIWDALGSLCL